MMALGKVVFTDRYLRSIKAAPTGKRQLIYDAAVPGHAIRVTDKSRSEAIGSFCLVKRFPGSSNPTPRKIGEYPGTPLAEARAIARQWLLDIAAGVDPAVKDAERQREEARRRADTFEVVFDAYAADHLVTLRSGTAVKAAITNHVFPEWRARPIASITHAEARAFERTLRVKLPVAVNRVHAYLGKFFSWCVDEGRIVISKILNHAEGGVTQVYDRHRYDREKQDALERWCTHVHGIVSGHTA